MSEPTEVFGNKAALKSSECREETQPLAELKMEEKKKCLLIFQQAAPKLKNAFFFIISVSEKIKPFIREIENRGRQNK